MTKRVTVERKEGVAWVTLNRVNKKNAVDNAMWLDLATAFTDIAGDGDIHAMVLRGEGPDFCAGGDLNDIDQIFSMNGPERGAFVAEVAKTHVIPCILALAAMPQIIICSTRGHVIGAGAQFALLADLVVASETSRFLFPFVSLAHTADHGESYALVRKVGAGRAMQILLMSESISATEAERFGIVNWVTPDAELGDRTAQLAKRFGSGASLAVRGTKELVKNATGDLEIQFEQEAKHIRTCAASDDFLEAIRAFGEKRRPVYSGR